jgi:hypothetical protein
MNRYFLKRVINVLYGFAGVFVAYQAFERLWDEGTFGNETYKQFFVMIGPYIGFAEFFAGITLALAQAADLFGSKAAIWLSRISFGCAMMSLGFAYLIFERWYMWGYWLDFIVWSLLCFVIYLPVIFEWGTRPGNDRKKLNNRVIDGFPD